MTQAELNYQSQLLDRHELAQKQWPDGKSAEFITEVTEVAAALEQFAFSIEATGCDLLELQRSWRYVGNAYQDIAIEKGSIFFLKAGDAYKKADALLKSVNDPVQRMKLDFSYGSLLVQLSEGKNRHIAEEAYNRLVSSLELAKIHMPEVVAGIEDAIAKAEAIQAASQKVSEYDLQIENLKEELANSPLPLEKSPRQVENQEIKLMIKKAYEKAVQQGEVRATRKGALDMIVDKLGDMLDYEPKDLEGKFNQSGQMREMMNQVTNFRNIDAQEKSLERRFSNIKIAVAKEMTRPKTGSETDFFGGDLYIRCGHACTFINKNKDDSALLKEYERDELRFLTLEIRKFLLRHHLSLINPVWPSKELNQNPNGVFYSGSDAVLSLVSEACLQTGLKIIGAEPSIDYASVRWEQIRSSNVAVFDYTGYRRIPDLGQVPITKKGSTYSAVSYELGIALTLGCIIIIIADKDQDLPFDVGVPPVQLTHPEGDNKRIAEALTDAVYSLPRGVSANSLQAAKTFLEQHYGGNNNALVAQSLKLIDDKVVADPVRFRYIVEPMLGHLYPNAPQIVFAPFPGSYPQLLTRQLFHITPFGPSWANDTMKITKQCCAKTSPHVEYIRGDQPLDTDIIRSIWDKICQSHYVVVDLTGLNANVLLELGIAHTLGRNVLLVTQDLSEVNHIPILMKHRIHLYTLDAKPGVSQLAELIDRFLMS